MGLRAVGRERDARRGAVAAAGRRPPEPETRSQEVSIAVEGRMEVIGPFAAKVAHDFNNVLTAIAGYGNLFLLRMKPDDPLRVYAEQILAASDRAVQMTRGLLAFGATQPLNGRPADVNEVVRRAVARIPTLPGEDIKLTLALWPDRLGVIADPDLLEQMTENVIVNACEAMPAGGCLTVRTEPAVPDEDPYLREGDGEALSYAVISVEDTGHGIDQPALERIFEPLFTTKPKGKGLGLGLSVVYGIVRQHGGKIRVTSEEGKGTVFKIYVPLMKTAGPEVSKVA